MSTSPQRRSTAIDAIAEEYYTNQTKLSPISLTFAGLAGREDELDDFSPAGIQAFNDLRATVLARLEEAPPTDDVDAVTVAAMRERFDVQAQMHELGHDLADINVMWSPMQMIREVFDVMPTETAEDLERYAKRLRAVDASLDGWLTSLILGADRGICAAQRQVLACIEQAQELSSGTGFFNQLLQQLLGRPEPVPAALRDEIESASQLAADAYASAARRLRDELLPRAPEADGIGRERYALASRRQLGAVIDVDETYAWAQDELTRITEEMGRIARRIAPGEGLAGAAALLDANPAYRVHGTDALLNWMQRTCDETVTALADTHFDIPQPVRSIECVLSPVPNGGVYYTPPGDGFSRPGRVTWSVAHDSDGIFHTWRELTTIHHEGVPGHHLQMGQTMFRAQTLNQWRRMGCRTSGHSEGWALYAEQLMAELGFMEDDAARLGMLYGERWRAARVILDLGIHCDLPAPRELDGGAWNHDKAWAFLTEHSQLSPSARAFELDRYYGWPGQASAYKVGERFWIALREEVRRREGADFSLKRFHRRALDLGGMGLDVLSSALDARRP